MNILYLSRIEGNLLNGPSYSVPSQVESQSKFDNVFWFNLIRKENYDWKKRYYYHDLLEFPKESIMSLPTPFNKPDLVIIEQIYDLGMSNIKKELVKNKIPYIIVPRSELTNKGQKRKFLKKKIANFLIFSKYIKKALSIQYLTLQEYKDSGDNWNKNYIIVPNGISIPNSKNEVEKGKKLQIISIGRIEPYQKGIDLLIDACAIIKKELVKEKCKITLYGPDVDKKVDMLNKMILNNSLGDVVEIKGPIYKSDKEKLLLNSDAFIITSRFEGLPMSVLEALSFAVPCLVTDGTNLTEDIKSYNAGWTARCDKNSIAEAILKMLYDSGEEWNRKKANAVKLAMQFDWNKIAENSHNIYMELLNKYESNRK